MLHVLLLFLAADFTNVAEEAGLTDSKSGRAVFVDLNGDGRLDVVLNKKHVHIQERPGKFARGEDLPFDSGVLLFADFDNDGDADCFSGAYCEPEKGGWVDHGRSNTLYRNDGGMRWKAVALKMPRTTVHAACALDRNRDGKLDLFLGSGYRVYGQSLECYSDRLYEGNGQGGFADATEKSGLLTSRKPGVADSSKPTYGVAHGDWNNDGKQDLWVCTYGRQWNFLWADGPKGFADVAATASFDGDADRSGTYPPWLKKYWKEKHGSERQDEAPFRSNGNTFDCAIADFDNDGDFDCILAEITHAWAGPSSDRTSLLVNRGPKEKFAFERRDAFPRQRTGQRWNQGDIHCGWIDFDNDGLLDALIASSDYPDLQELKLYRQKPDHTFEDARSFDWEGAGQISVGDYDRDGDQDILVGRSLNRLPKERREALGPACALFRNDVGAKNAWLQVACVGKRANRDGIGCRIEVTTKDGVTQTREIRGGLGHAGHNGPYVAHFGLGGREGPVRVVVRWPDAAGSKTVRKNVKPRQRLVVRQ